MCVSLLFSNQTVQLSFLRAVRTMDPDAISAVLRAHPYHIDSLLQLSEVRGRGYTLLRFVTI